VPFISKRKATLSPSRMLYALADDLTAGDSDGEFETGSTLSSAV
jgi:hypothetical protein